MRFTRLIVCILTAHLLSCISSLAQGVGQPSSPLPGVTVPRLIRLTGSLRDEAGKAETGSVGITFALYRDEKDQDVIWQETQVVPLGSAGRYSVLLGATNEAGLPLEIFSAGEPRWLGVRADGHAEQPRILFVSVAYALKAADSEMLGGRPASAFVLAENLSSSAQSASGAPAGSGSSQSTGQVTLVPSGALPLLVPPTTCSAVTSDGAATANHVAKFTTACNIENSAIFESGGNVGIGNTSPAGALDVSGTVFTRGLLTAMAGIMVAPSGTATATQGFTSTPLDIDASLFNTTLGRAANYIFRWQTEPVGNDTASTSATLNLLYGVTGSVSETGISVDKNGIMSFAPGQTFPGSGGTVTSVGTGAGLTGGPITTTGTISIPSAGVTNAMLANSSVTVQAGSGLSGGGTVALGGTVTLTGNLSGTTNGLAYFSNPTSVTSTSAPANGQILIGSSGKAPVLATLTAGPNVSISNGPGSVTISAAGGGAPTLPFYVTGSSRTGSSIGPVKNVTKLWGFLLPYNVVSTTVIYDVTTVDNTANLYDIGIFDNSGNLLVNIGPTAGTAFSPAKGFLALSWLQGPTTLLGGRYYLGLTTTCATTCAKVAAGATTISFATNASAGATVGGTLPTNVAPPADSWATGNQPSVVIQ